jgi:hypothetical protein
MKKYILIMGLMTCMCLMATSCKSEDEDDVSKSNVDASVFTMSSLLRHGEHPGYWVVNGIPADSCIMSYDGEVFSFTSLPIEAVLKVLELYRDEYTAQGINEYQVEADPLVLLPVLIGYSEANFYFNSSVQHVSIIPPSGYEEDYSAMYYSFVVDNGEEKIPFSMVFDRDTYGIYNAGKKSQVIKLYIKGITFLLPNRNEITVSLNPMMELAFISND